MNIMPDIARHRLLPAILLLVATGIARADAVSDLPDALADRLQPVAEVSVDTLDPDAREQLTEARRLVVDAILQQHPDAELATAYGELAALYQVQHVYTAADLCYRNARTLAPDSFRWAYLHGYLASLNGETGLAIERYQQARALRPDYLAVTLRLADAWLDLNEQDKAQAAYRQVEHERGLQAAATYGLGQIALLRRRFPEAIDRFEQTLALQPEASRVHYSLAQALRAGDREEEAREHLQQLGDRLPAITDPLIDSLESLQQGSRVYFSRAMKASKKRDYASARDDFASGLEREPDNIEARISYARTLYLTDAGEEATKQLEDVLSRDADNTLALFLRGVIAEEAGEVELALDYYRHVLAREPGHAGANFYLANHYYRTGQPEKAVQHYEATLTADPENFNAYLPYAGALLQTGHAAPDVLAVIESARKRFPDQPVLRYLHIQLLACPETQAACDPGRALADATELVEQQSLPPHRELLALANAANGDFTTAASLQEAVVSDAVWMMPMEIERLRRGLSAYQAGEMPPADALFTRRLLQAPRTRAADVLRDYPTPKPY
jgi:tetratricopeptide (TPR) repeat protein